MKTANFFRSVDFFSKQFFIQKSDFSPPYLPHGKRYRAEIFSTYTRHYLGWVLFFIPKNIALVIFGSVYKICPIKKTSVFEGASGILAFLAKKQKIQGNQKKYPPRIVSSICKKSFSSIERSISENGG
jgi:hypothetical protein